MADIKSQPTEMLADDHGELKKLEQNDVNELKTQQTLRISDKRFFKLEPNLTCKTNPQCEL